MPAIDGPRPTATDSWGIVKPPGSRARAVAPAHVGHVARQLLTLQGAAGNQAVAQLLGGLSREVGGATAVPEAASAPAVAPPSEGTALTQIAVVDQDGTNPKKSRDGSAGLNLRADSHDHAPILGRLAHNDHLMLNRAIGTWFYAAVTDGEYKGAAGYVASIGVETNMPPDPEAPDPGATLHRIVANERAYAFVRRHYGAATTVKGQDERFFTNVLQFVNDRAGRHFIVAKTKPRKFGGMSVEVNDQELVAGGQIWVPSLDYALSLKGVVSAGSWERDAWEKIKGFGEKLASIPAFAAGLIVGALESIKDLFVGLFDLVWETIKTLGRNLVDAASSIWELVSNEKKRRLLLEHIADELSDLLYKGSFLRRAFNWGRVIGYATMEVLSFVLMAGAAAALKAGKWAGRLSAVVAKIKELPAIRRVLTTAEKLAHTPAVRRIREAVAPVAKGAGTVAGAVGTVTAAPGRALLAIAESVSKTLEKVAAKFGLTFGREAAAAARLRAVAKYLGGKLGVTKVGGWLKKAIAKLRGRAAKAALKGVDVAIDERKFSQYIFKEGATHGKDRVFRRLGYGREHAAELAETYRKQAAQRYASGEYEFTKKDLYGQRIDIEITLEGIGDATGKVSHIRSGWMIRPDGSISLNTPFSGFMR